MSSNQAAWLDGQGQKLRVAPVEMPSAGKDEVVIRTGAVAVNPLDYKIQDLGLFFDKKWPPVIGYDVAGEVVEVGEGVQQIKKGDRVTAFGSVLHTFQPKNGGFQNYTAVHTSTAAIIPASTSFKEAAVIPSAFNTAVVALSGDGALGLPLPSNTEPCGKTLVIWGGSSSVGTMATQLATLVGAKVIAVASSHNFDLCRKCGAVEVLDYKTSTIDEDVVAAVKKLGGDFAGVLDCVSLPGQSLNHTVPILEALGGGKLAVLLPGQTIEGKNVEVYTTFGSGPLAIPLWRDWIPKALEDGRLKCLPEPLVVGTGLESIQPAVDQMRKGVSGKKVVVEL